MKTILMLVSSILFTNVCVASDDLSLQIGAGISSSTSPYKGISNVTMPLPDIEFSYKSAFIEGINMGYNFYDTKTLQVGVVLLPTLLGYKTKDSDSMSGMENRTMSLEGGLRLHYNFEHSFLSSSFSQDISGTTEGYTFNTVYNYTICETHNLALSLYTGVEYLSDKKSDYYYGVKEKEATLSRASYHANGALNPFIGLTYIVTFHQKWSILTNVEYKHFDSSIFNSPIIDEHYQVAGYLALMYSF